MVKKTKQGISKRRKLSVIRRKKSLVGSILKGRSFSIKKSTLIGKVTKSKIKPLKGVSVNFSGFMADLGHRDVQARNILKKKGAKLPMKTLIKIKST